MVRSKAKGWRLVGRMIGAALLILLAVVQLFPLIWMLDYSLCESRDLFGDKILQWPEPFNWDNYRRGIFDSNFFLYFRNSVFVTGTSVLLVVVFSLMSAFACVKMKWKLSGIVSVIFLLGLMIPGHVTLLPNFLVFSRLRITDTWLAYLLPYTAFPLATGFLLTSQYIKTIPRELEEAALIDGAGAYRVLFQVIFPIMKPSLTTVMIMTFLGNWNEYISAMTYTSRIELRTLPFLVKDFTGLWSSDYALQFAVMMLSVIPALIVYIILNKYIVKGIAVGAVKT